jgi:fatty-acyl-CoA synthase
MDRGIRIMGGYGMSETCPIISIAQLKPEDVQAAPETRLDVITRAGFAIPLACARAVDIHDQPLPPGREHTGELVLQAPWLTRGYFKETERSRNLWRTGWLHTGDMGCVDAEGYLRITDRIKDVIKIGGEWISSLELENIIAQHEAVKEVAVIGVPDAKWDERPLALVVLHDPLRKPVTPRDIARFLHKFIDTGVVHKRAILTHIQFVDSLPRTSVGKFDKKALRARTHANTPPAAAATDPAVPGA